MHLTLLTPLGALFALTALVPVAVAVVRLRRMGRVREALSLPAPPVAGIVVTLVSLAAVPLVLGIAATQPVIETTRTLPERTDAQVFVVVDISRSMLASAGPRAPSRFERARRVAERIAAGLPELPIGLAGLSDRVLPYLFPTTDERVVDATLEGAVGVEQPPPSGFYLTEATSLSALAQVPELNYFTPAAKKRVLVVLTDGETQPLDGGLAAAFERPPRIATIYVRFGSGGERIYTGGIVETAYRPSSRSTADLARAASMTNGRVFSEGQVDDVVRAVRDAVGAGPTVRKRHEGGRFPLMPYVTALALLPLLVVLLRRNVWLAVRGRRALREHTRSEPVPEGAKVSEPRGVAQPG